MVHARLTGFAAADTSLSTREQDCLTYVATGCRVTEIAECLGIAETTVELHLRNARRRLGARTRDQAAARALVSGLIEI